MNSNENYVPYAAVAAGLSVAILVLFQVYLVREPARISADEVRNQKAAVDTGQTLFANNCVTCHGEKGEGSDIAPSLNNKEFLSKTDDDTIFSIVSSGVPNTRMPAWNQSHGGPMTDEDVRNLVAFIRSWQANAPDVTVTVRPGDANQGAAIFNGTCIVCHGPEGKGTDRAPALNDPAKLQQFNDSWYRQVIMDGRPAQGMPTWGTVLSPEQINDVLALFDLWRSRTVTQTALLTSTPALQSTPSATTVVATATAAPPSTSAGTVTATEQVARPSNAGGPGAALSLTGDLSAGAQVYTSNCQTCHGHEGKGGVTNPGSSDGTIPPLNPIDDTIANKDTKVFAYNVDLFVEHGSTPDGPNPQQSMPAWGDDKKLTPQQIADVIAYIISLNK